ncbi:hypothetical protein Cfla_2774 [Cellulomonas flavigena DSM 20109]|uniref:Uncharacterized protein n=1 Tax=Cellulomonas flavigena (strain ATCC 482 / DSM 20109 / BCRC 11376 / JCM 18109 / NBRC 3775 / NCIMB 8073 / NRS 134) TaxID=446466 RepID=D5UJM1_CELFN|nr:hypothetical protein [Cellulomonas flavigena]ADG75659.1 hypothetical protein Cfla_2774 [Cellulomonas flavigena DSM 20109]
MTPLPSPSPIHVVLRQASSGTDWWTPGVLVPLTVALVALSGVVWSTWHNARASRKAEDRRAHAAIAAEDRRAAAAIDAENLRHEHAIEAENLRHEHAIEAARKGRVVEARHQFYVELEAARIALSDALGAIPTMRSESIDPERQQRLRQAVEQFAGVRATAGLHASREVERAAAFVQEAASLFTIGQPSVPPTTKQRTREEHLRQRVAELRDKLRAEVGVED